MVERGDIVSAGLMRSSGEVMKEECRLDCEVPGTKPRRDDELFLVWTRSAGRVGLVVSVKLVELLERFEVVRKFWGLVVFLE